MDSVGTFTDCESVVVVACLCLLYFFGIVAVYCFDEYFGRLKAVKKGQERKDWDTEEVGGLVILCILWPLWAPPFIVYFVLFGIVKKFAKALDYPINKAVKRAQLKGDS